MKVQVRDDVQERYTSSGALQLRAATTAPEAWEAMDSAVGKECTIEVNDKLRQSRT